MQCHLFVQFLFTGVILMLVLVVHIGVLGNVFGRDKVGNPSPEQQVDELVEAILEVERKQRRVRDEIRQLQERIILFRRKGLDISFLLSELERLEKRRVDLEKRKEELRQQITRLGFTPPDLGGTPPNPKVGWGWLVLVTVFIISVCLVFFGGLPPVDQHEWSEETARLLREFNEFRRRW